MTSDKVEQLSREQFRTLSAKPKRSKFGAVRTTVDGITFASKLEAARWGQLKLLERAGEIRQLRRQVRHQLIGYTGEPVCAYVSDFDYVTRFGLPVTEDTKGVITPVFRIKSKLFAQQMGREIQIVGSAS